MLNWERVTGPTREAASFSEAASAGIAAYASEAASLRLSEAAPARHATGMSL